MPRILIVDDEAFNRHLVARIVQGLGHEPAEAANGREALDILQARHDIDLLITDLRMPILDGRALLRSLRDDPRLRELPVIVMSGCAGFEGIPDDREFEGIDFLAKPLHISDLEAHIATCLEEPR